jgi:hypothetical protein
MNVCALPPPAERSRVPLVAPCESPTRYRVIYSNGFVGPWHAAEDFHRETAVAANRMRAWAWVGQIEFAA